MIQGRGYGNIVLFVLFVLLPITYSFPYSEYILIATIFFTSLPMFFLLRRKRTTDENGITNTIIAFAINLFWMILMLTNSGLTASTFIRLVQMLGCMFAFVSGSLIMYQRNQLTFIRRVVQAIIVVNFTVWILSGMPMQNFSFLISNTATYGSVLLCWMLFLSVFEEKNLFDWLILILGVMLLFFSSTRSSLAAILVFDMVTFIIKRHLKRKGNDKAFLKTILLLSIFGCVVFVFFYTESGYTELGMKINQLSIAYFGKNLYSGRQAIWHELIRAIKENPITGYGLNALPSDIYDTHLSAHNTFFQVAIQSGMVGLLLLFNILISISRNVIKNNNCWFESVGIALIVSIILHECFEACLVQNMLVAGLQMWFLMGLTVNRTFIEDEYYEKTCDIHN